VVPGNAVPEARRHPVVPGTALTESGEVTAEVINAADATGATHVVPGGAHRHPVVPGNAVQCMVPSRVSHRR
jgi:hypothetical protein